MKKLRLNVEELEIEQFSTESPEGKQGTVRAHVSDPTECGDSMNAYTAPCRLCPDMPITFTCE
ncbi:MAG TPA: hypothetical protein VF541_05255 [Longimicrobium sp.]|jgi:hypothetical protein